MRVDEIIASNAPTFSVEFFPPKTEESRAELFATARSLRELEPDFVSVTYGAGGSTREGTVEVTRALKDELGYETMAHLSCVGETTEGLAETLDQIAAQGKDVLDPRRADRRTSSSSRAGLAAPPSWPPSSAAAGSSPLAAPVSPRCIPRLPTSPPTSPT